MKISIPQNIFSAIFGMKLPASMKENVNVLASSLIAKNIENGNTDIGLMPSCDLLNHNELFVSRTLGLSFDGLLSNSYIYFAENERMSEVYLNGDVSSNEIILSKILFTERFNTEIKPILDTSEVMNEDQNYLIVGNDNFGKVNFNQGLSFADQIAEMIDYPYVNFVWVAKDEEKLKRFSGEFEKIDEKIEDSMEAILERMSLSIEIKDFVIENLNSIYFEMTENEVTGLHELLKLPYYHGIVKEMYDLKFV